MATISELLQQKEALEQQIRSMQSEARADAIAKVRALMAEHGLTAADLSGKAPPAVSSEGAVKRPVAVKYRDKSGHTWTGRGLKPTWLNEAIAAGKKPEDFLV